MSVKSKIRGYLNGCENELAVGHEGELFVVVHGHPPRDESQILIPFSSRFSDNGMPDGSKDMNIDGSVTPVKFYISALEDKDIYLSYISVEISDGGTPNLNKFGNLSALTNGVKWEPTPNAVGFSAVMICKS